MDSGEFQLQHFHEFYGEGSLPGLCQVYQFVGSGIKL